MLKVWVVFKMVLFLKIWRYHSEESIRQLNSKKRRRIGWKGSHNDRSKTAKVKTKTYL